MDFYKNPSISNSISSAQNLRACIDNVISFLPDIYSLEFQIAEFHFQSYVLDSYQMAQDSNEEGFFIDELFVTISLAQLSQNTFHYLVFLASLLEIDLGDKVSKANRIARDLVNIQPDSNPLIFKLLKKILLWLNKTLKNSIQFIINPLLDMGWKSCCATEEDKKISGLMLIRLFMKNFPIYLENQLSLIQEIVIENIKSHSMEVRRASLKILKSYLFLSSLNYDMIQLCGKLNQTLCKENWMFFQGAIEASELIIKYHPKLIGCFVSNEVPFMLFQEKDTDILTAVCRLIPFSLKTSRALFGIKDIENLLNSYITLITKRQSKSAAFISLGKVLFLLETVDNPRLLNLIQKCHSLAEDSIDSSSGIFALIAIDSIFPEKYAKDEMSIFSKKLSSLIISGLNQFVLIHPEFSTQVQTRVFQMTCSIILNSSSTPEMIKLAFDSLIQMKIQPSFFKAPLIVQMLSQLSNPNFEVRESAANFALSYQESIETSDISQIILSFIVTEPNQKLRIKMIKEVKFTSNVEIISHLHSLLHDTNRQIRKEALNLLSKSSKGLNNSLICEILSDFLLEKIPNDNELMTKEGIECFLIVSSHIETTETIIIPFSKFLIVHLIGENRKLPSKALSLLSQIIKLSPKDVDIDKLVLHVSQSLNVFSSRKRLEACLDLLHSAIKYTNLMEEIYSKHLELFVKLLSNSQLSESYVSRSKLIRVLAPIGAIKNTIVQSLLSTSKDQKKKRDVETAQFFISQSDSIDPYQSLLYASVGVALSNLLSILQDSSLAALHAAAIESLLIILKCYRSVGRKLENFLLKQINNLVINGNPSTVSLLLTNMPTLISVLDQCFSPLVPHVVDFICQKWNVLDKSLLLRISEWMMMYVSDDFRPYLPRVVSVFLRDFNSYDERIVDGIVSAFVSFNESIQDVAHVAYPALLNWVLHNATSTNACNEILHKLKLIFVSGGVLKFSSLIVRISVLTGKLNTQLHMRLLEILSVVALQSGQSFLLFLPQIKSVIDITINPLFCSIIKSLRNCSSFEEDALALAQHSLLQKASRKHNPAFMNPPYPNKTNQTQFTMKIPLKEWNKGQWDTWCSETFSTIIRSNASRAISACSLLSERHTRLRDSVYPLAFVLSYVAHMNEVGRTIDSMKLLKSVMEVVFSSHNVPQSIIRHFLAVIELMEITGTQIPFSKKMIADAAISCGLYAQALRATEALFEQKSDSEITEQLIQLNQKLGLKLAASGVFQYAKRKGIRTSKATLSESLGLWNDALAYYEEKQTNDSTILNRKLRCYQKLLKFDELKKASSGTGSFYEAVASWSLFEYDNFLRIVENYTKNNENSQEINDFSFYQAIYLIMKGDTEGAKKIINSLLDASNGIFPIISEDYLRVVSEFSSTSNAAMLHEVIKYKKMQSLKNSPSPLEREKAVQEMNRISRCWSLRFNNLTEETVILFDFLTIESLVLSHNEMKDHWLKFIQTAIKQNYFSIAQSVNNHLKTSIDKKYQNEFRILECDLLWAQGMKTEAIEELNKMSQVEERLHDRIEMSLAGYLLNQERHEEAYKHLERLNLTENGEFGIKYSNYWLRVNSVLYESTGDEKYLQESLKTLLDTITRVELNRLTHALQVLAIVFRKGNQNIYEMFSSKVEKIPVSCWLEVIPQIIARLSSPTDELRVVVVNLIYKIGLEHPHAVLYPLLVPFKSDNVERSRIASSLFDRLRLQFQKIVDGVVLLSDELMRVAVSWHEIGQTQLEKASRAFYVNNDVDEMIRHLQPIQEIVKKFAETFYEVSFISQFGEHLQTASYWIDSYKATKDERSIEQAWQHLGKVQSKIKTIVDSMNTVPLIDASSRLAEMNNSEISVPGTYDRNKSLVTIRSFGEEINIIKSKQRPRKMTIWGSDGEKFTFVLKAHEDTRLDERVMQLFGYINSLIDQSSFPMKSCLSIVTYKVIPLTCEVGLIGWVPDCITLFEIIREYREKHKVQVEQEYVNLKRNSPNYESLSVSEKVGAFEKSLAATKGDDLKQILLDKARDSQDWLNRRSTYTGSLGSTSMSGYILGLGDRHFYNIMMKSKSAKLVHIDFGDCFEVAMHRDQYPEKVPIRLTRLLLNALEVSKIEGTFRSCCENVMSLMRANDENIMCLLEAFIYDPLLQWSEEKGTAVGIVERIKDKLSGNDFGEENELSVEEQVEALINQATNTANLCVMFRGWSPWW